MTDTEISPIESKVNAEVEQPAVGYIGLNHHHADPYLKTLEALPVTVICACEPDTDFNISSVPFHDDVSLYGDPQTMLSDSDIDAVFITLSNRDTPAIVSKALQEGIDIYTEKPAARTATELEQLVNIQERSDAIACVSYPWQRHPIVGELKQLFECDFFGDLRGFEARFVASQITFRDTSHFLFEKNASRGGVLQWLGVHWIQLFSWLLEESIERVNARMVAGTDGVDVEDGATLQFETTSGAIGTLNCGYYLGEGRYDTQLDFYGTDGQASWSPIGPSSGFEGETTLGLEAVCENQAGNFHQTITHEYGSVQGYGGKWGRKFIQEFFDARIADKSPPVGLENALTVLRILDAAYESAETGRWVDVSPLHAP